MPYLSYELLLLLLLLLLLFVVFTDVISKEAVDYLSIPESKLMALMIKIVHFGNTEFYGGKHLTKLVSSKPLHAGNASKQLVIKSVKH